MNMAPLILITTPILLPVVANFGMDPLNVDHKERRKSLAAVLAI